MRNLSMRVTKSCVFTVSASAAFSSSSEHKTEINILRLFKHQILDYCIRKIHLKRNVPFKHVSTLRVIAHVNHYLASLSGRELIQVKNCTE